MTRYAMVLDLHRCVGCQACVVTCKAEWQVPRGYSRDWVHPIYPQGTFPEVFSSFYVGLCNHCDSPSCIPACPTGATFQDESGRVRVDRDVCIGCGLCVETCPYDARYPNPEINKVDKCDFCFPRTEQGMPPACVKTCIADARIFGDLEDKNSEVYDLVYRQGAKRLSTEDVSIGPNVYYLGTADQISLILQHYPPKKEKLTPPPAGQMLGKVFRPLIFAAIGMTFVGQSIAFFYQLLKGEPPVED